MDAIPKKSLGQNFLQDEEVITGILEVAQVSQSDWILEIGPGTGALTEALKREAGRVLAIEIDQALAKSLAEGLAASSNVEIIEGDILKLHLEELLREKGYTEHGYSVVANLPYYITAPIIRKMLALEHPPQALTLMVQDEVADRLAAAPGKMSLLSVMAQYYAMVEKKLFVPRSAFFPVPGVDSAVVRLVPRKRLPVSEDALFFRLAKAGFSARRKTLANNLAAAFGLPKEVIEEKILALGLRKDVRAQALSIGDWQQLRERWS